MTASLDSTKPYLAVQFSLVDQDVDFTSFLVKSSVISLKDRRIFSNTKKFFKYSGTLKQGTQRGGGSEFCPQHSLWGLALVTYRAKPRCRQRYGETATPVQCFVV